MGIFNNIYFNIIDISVIVVVLSSCIVATYRGFIKETFSILSWIISLIVAFKLYEKFRLELVDHISQKIVIDVIAFGFPFLTSLLISHLISAWLSPKFSISSILVVDKFFGFVFGAFRGVLLVVLLYLGFLYLIGKEKKTPNILLEAYTLQYIKTTANLITQIFINQIQLPATNNEKPRL